MIKISGAKHSGIRPTDPPRVGDSIGNLVGRALADRLIGLAQPDVYIIDNSATVVRARRQPTGARPSDKRYHIRRQG